MAADCKSAAPCELRRFESSPVHQISLVLDESVVDSFRRVRGIGGVGMDDVERSQVQVWNVGDSGNVRHSYLVVEQEVGSRAARASRKITGL